MISDDQLLNLPVKNGFVYDNATEQRLLKSKDTGFVEPDKKNSSLKFGNIDWTDHDKVQVSWRGVHRYAGVGLDLKVYKAGHTFDLALVENNAGTSLAGITGVVAGASFKNTVLIAFVWNHTGIGSPDDLTCYLIKNNRVLYAETLGYYSQILQCVAIAPDCSKAAFIAVPYANHTVIVDVALVMTGTLSAAISNTEYQDVFSYVYFNDPGVDSFPYRDLSSVTVAVDFNSAGTKQTFFISTEFSHTFSQSITSAPALPDITTEWIGIYYNPSSIPEGAAEGEFIADGTLDIVETKIETNTQTAAVNFNDQALSAVNRVDTITQITTHHNDVGHSYGVVWRPELSEYWVQKTSGFLSETSYEMTTDEVIAPYDWNYINPDNLDLRYGLFAYTDISKTGTAASSNYDLQSSLKIGAFSHAYTAASSTSVFEKVLLREISGFLTVGKLALKVRESLFQTCLYVKIYNAFLSLDDAYLEGNEVRGLSLVDKYANKLCQLEPISGLNVDSSGIFDPLTYTNAFTYAAKTVLKLDNANTGYANDITNLKGIM